MSASSSITPTGWPGIPGVLLHGRFDISSPADVPWLLSRAWPNAELRLVSEGHLGDTETAELMKAALDGFATR